MGVRIFLAGHVRIEVDEVALADPGLGSLGRLALAYLVTERHRPVATDELAVVLWDDCPPPTWRTALRGSMSKIRSLLADAGLARDQVLASGPGWYQLRLPAGVVVDVEEATGSLSVAEDALVSAHQASPAQVAVARDAAGVALGVATQPFVVGGVGGWVERRQAELGELRVRALEVLAGALSLAGDTPAAVARAQEAVGLEPLRESAHIRLMEALAAGGNRGAALRAYERCRRLLVEELGVGPSSQTEAVYLGLLALEPAAKAQQVAGPKMVPLPIPLTSFVGRRAELADVRGLLGGTRLLTVTGPGGVGKSRLALEVADQEAEDGIEVVLVELAPLADPQRVAGAVAETLGLAEGPGGDVVLGLVSHLADRRILLVLDNCEHLVEACATLTHALLRTCPGVRILATSQTRLRVAGEITWALAPLGIPTGAEDQLAGVLATEAGALFAARAEAARSDLDLSDADTDALAQVCRRLDGLPLALELAAAHARLLSVGEIAAGLDGRLDLLSDGDPTGPSRHQTLRATLDWSHGRLSERQSRLLARLSVFAGGFTLDAALDVVSDDEADRSGLYADLVGLADASLVQADLRHRVARYGLLEIVRHDAAERLKASGESPARHDRLLSWATSLAEEVAPALEGAGQREELDRLAAEHANLAAALAWGSSGAAPGAALALVAALGRYWEVRGHLGEGRAWSAQVLADPSIPTTLAPVRAWALGAAAGLAQRQGDDGAARGRLEESLDIHRNAGDLAGEAATLHGLGLLDARAGDVSSARSRYLNSLAIGRQLGAPAIVATALANLGWLAQGQADFSTAATLLEESLRLFRREGAAYGTAWSLYFLGRVAEAQGHLAEARLRYEESLVLRREQGDPAGTADVLAALGSLALHRGDLAGARSLHEESLALRRKLGDAPGTLESLRHLGDVARLALEPAEARRYYRESLRIAERYDDVCCVTRACLGLAKVARAEDATDEAWAQLDQAAPVVAESGADALLAEWLEGVAGVAVDHGDVDGDDDTVAWAARLWGLTETLRHDLGVPLPSSERAGYVADVDRGRQLLGPAPWAEAMAEGRVLELGDVIDEARRRLRFPPGG